MGIGHQYHDPIIRETVTKPTPPTARDVVTWCHGEESDWIIKGTQLMLDRYVEHSELAEKYKELCGKLREYVEWRHLGLGGENLEELVLARAKELESMLARVIGCLNRVEVMAPHIAELKTESHKLMPQVERTPFIPAPVGCGPGE